ncbi:MAG: hypothetical protein COA44_01995 [Arcobacter sp.]|nr:MAG: hypothetical protein COA44_01995 [Arcobacter sp.]
MKTMLGVIFTFFLLGCSTLELTTNPSLPLVKDVESITVFSLDNYTDTPQAGMRASNLIEGVLLSKEYKTVNAISLKTKNLSDQLRIARENGSDYLLTGGVSEWRYKTGIDGEPAISLQCKLISVDTSKVIWSKTASSNDWGNASIGTTAQAMISLMFDK